MNLPKNGLKELHDPWDNSDGVEDYHQPFAVPGTDQETREAAALAVKEAIAAFHQQTRWQTFVARLRFFAFFWFWYKPRLAVAMWFTKTYCKAFNKDSGDVSRKVWLRLGL